ncbi:DUF2271 domain-containing protein [Marinitenerispora sediminis]|uniref:DUF2271 domain-containing protein n=1 Tax=Marinitenerispora sediminis TaxID=1931232 RepID=A0A368T5D7_9ACTN|nr:DUF2271 domain-containing protein [Marinitenerispora sediminis]RCV50132.1 DUF2271 domain-containing protein [Marinitenerispora sediminis]RCV54549.1 DUF2271 domain-containing protein [Marinitenerispora sediminis]RCV58792.1 DUF2271 domain-containing protein [Marinitenerispora sediminis]
MPDRRIRVVVPLVVVTGVATVAAGAHFGYQVADRPPMSVAAGPSPAPGDAEPGAPVPAADTLGLVAVSYQLNRLPQLASNQIAIWIEDEDGEYVRTLFATSFTANGGYARRPMSLSLWRETSGWESASQAEVESASRPAQPSGRHTVYWDGADRDGRPVPAGRYTYRIEGNIRWENRVLHSGTITVGDQPDSSSAQVEYLPAGAAREGELLADVGAVFTPGETLDPAVLTTFTQGS